MPPLTPRPAVVRRGIAILLILALTLLLPGAPRPAGVGIAAAKAQFLDTKALGILALNQPLAARLALTDAAFLRFAAPLDLEFVSAVRLGPGESSAWRDAGCSAFNCALLTYFDHAEGGTVEAVMALDSRQILAHWRDTATLPGASEFVARRAMAIAAADAGVQAVLGDLATALSAMIPMSAWLEDDACRDAWCLDLTFHAPDGSGRIFHVFVNMEADEVARTFYSRARAERSFTPPASALRALQTDSLYDNGCHNQYGWDVCWDMTAHDGVNFRDARFQGDSVFSSIKIGQIEVWYPSWPGGYRDEIGFQAAVPPKFGTNVTDLGDGFEVRQLFTEPFDWPNCICCYRYEQVMRFFADGSFEPRFVSHGPGCDDPSVYRPFWRLDLELDGEAGNEVWLWQDGAWTEMPAETTFDLYQDTSPLGDKVAQVVDGLSYRWRPERNDPFGVDEARVFALADRAGEGDGPILTGPANTFQPPAQWLDDEPLAGADPVFWYVPILKTKKGGPWWCMPDPAPDFSPCESIVRLARAGALSQPTAEEIAQAPPTPTVGPTVTPAPTSTPMAIAGVDAVSILSNAGCVSCHAIGALGEAHKVGPDLSGIGAVAGDRVPGLSAADYLRQSILMPAAFVTPNCPNGPCLANIMPADYALRLSAAQVETVVQYLLTLVDLSPAAEATLPAAVGDAGAPGPVAGTLAPSPAAGAPDEEIDWLPVGILLLALVAFLSATWLIARRLRAGG